MIETTRTATGWVIETTNERNGCLEQGGICGRRVLYTNDQIRGIGCDPDDDPEITAYNDGATVAEYLLHSVEPSRVIRHGTVIQ